MTELLWKPVRRWGVALGLPKERERRASKPPLGRDEESQVAGCRVETQGLSNSVRVQGGWGEMLPCPLGHFEELWLGDPRIAEQGERKKEEQAVTGRQ
jgi:hypothetical protein